MYTFYTQVYVLIDFFKDDYDRLRPLAFPGMDVVLAAFGVDHPNSFANLTNKWLPEIDHFLINVPRIIVGTRSGINPCCPRKIFYKFYSMTL